MAVNRRAAKRDKNEPEIIKALEDAGATVQTISEINVKGFPDLIVGYRGVNYLLEVKTLNGRLSDEQHEFLVTWQGQTCVVYSADDALDAIGAST